MEEIVKIPIAGILQLDDVGWDNGRDLRLIGQASRSGLPRYHAIEDYKMLRKFGKALEQKIWAPLALPIGITLVIPSR